MKQPVGEGISIRGRWWLPDYARRKIPGLLTYTPEAGARLECDGLLRPGVGIDEYPPAETFILGRGSDGQKVTIHDSLPVTVRRSDVGRRRTYSVSSYLANFIFLGHLFPHAGELEFVRAAASCAALTAWTKLRVFSSDYVEGGVRLTCVRPPSVSLLIPDAGGVGEDAHLSISWATRENLGMNSCTTTCEPQVSLEFKKPRPFSQLLPLFQSVLLFFELGARVPFLPDRLLLFREKKPRQEIGLLEPSAAPPRREDIFWPNMYYTFPDIQSDFSRLLTTWIARVNEGRLDAVMEMYREVLCDLGPPVFQFLLVTSALETYHRRVVGGAWIDKTTAGCHKELMLAAVPAEYRGQWRKKLDFAHELSLRERLDQLCVTLAPVADYAGIDSAFLKAVVDTRNYYVHWDPNSLKKSIPWSELLIATSKLLIMLEAVLMLETGFSLASVEENVRRSSSARRDAKYPAPLPTRTGASS